MMGFTVWMVGMWGQPKVLGAAGRSPAAGKGGIWVRCLGGTDRMVGRQVGRSGRVLGIFAKRELARLTVQSRRELWGLRGAWRSPGKRRAVAASLGGERGRAGVCRG